jgi:hypothetical protein
MWGGRACSGEPRAPNTDCFKKAAVTDVHMPALSMPVLPEVVVLGDSPGGRSRAPMPVPMPILEPGPAVPHASKMLLVATQEICDLFARLASKVSQLFRDWDLDGNGLIDKKEFRAACTSLGVVFPRDIVDGVFDILDDDGSGSIDHGDAEHLDRHPHPQPQPCPRSPCRPH